MTIALNALAVDPGFNWKRIRWFSEENHNCRGSLENFKNEGISLKEFSSLFRCNGLEVKESYIF